jgi:hypothetical protein
MDPENLNVVADPTTYDRNEIHSMLSMIKSGALARAPPHHRTAGNTHSGGLSKCASGYGVIGFVKFLHGHYLYLVTAVRKVGAIGGHIVYTIEDTALIPVPHPTAVSEASSKRTKAQEKKARNLEARYKSYFQLMDLSKNFYFSYTYDLTLSLQTSMLRARETRPPPSKVKKCQNSQTLDSVRCVGHVHLEPLPAEGVLQPGARQRRRLDHQAHTWLLRAGTSSSF